jgi:hypothetical protein
VRAAVRTRVLSLDPYATRVLCVVGDDFVAVRDVFARELGTHFKSEGFAESLGRTLTWPDGLPRAVWLRSQLDPAVIAHEAFHVVSGCLGQRGLELCKASEEAYAYLLEKVVREMADPKGFTKVKPSPVTASARGIR